MNNQEINNENLNTQKILQINNRLDEIVRQSNSPILVSEFVDGKNIARIYLQEYNALLRLRSILIESKNRKDDIPYLSQNRDVPIKEDLAQEYDNLMNIVNLPSLDATNIEDNKNTIETTTNVEDVKSENPTPEETKEVEQSEKVDPIQHSEAETIDDKNIEEKDELSKLKDDAKNKIDSLDISDEFKNEYKDSIDKANDEQFIKMVLNAAEKQNKQTFIPNTKIPMPRAKGKDETIEDYEKYLKEYYKPYGYADDNEIYYPETNIPIPRRPYPHETYNNNFMDKDSYYNQMLRYYADKYKNYNKANEINPEYTGPVADNEQLAVIPEKNKTPLMPIDKTPELDDEEHEVSKIRKAINFLKKHKKKIIIGLGLTTLAATLFVPGVGPALMCANAKLWSATSIPFFRGVLHGANCVLASMIGATEVSSGLWAFASTGALINETAAASSLLGALAGGALQVASTVGIVKAIGEAKNKVVNWFKKKRKSKKQDKVQKADNNLAPEVEEENENEKEKTNDKVKNTDLIDKLNARKTYLAQALSKANTTEQVNEIQREMIKIDSAIDKINDGRNTPITETVDYKGYRVKPDDVEKLNEIVEPKITEEEAKSTTTSLKEKYQATKDAVIKAVEQFKTPEDIKEGSIKR